MVLFLSLALTLAANGEEARAKLKQALTLVESARFEQAAPMLQGLLSPPTLKGADLRAARIAYAQTLFYTGAKKRAKSELKLLFKKFPSATVDTNSVAPDFVEFFAAAKAEKAEAKEPDKTQKVVKVEIREPSPVEKVEEKPAEKVVERPAEKPPVLTQTRPEPEPPPPALPPKEIVVAPTPSVEAKQPVAKTAYQPAPWYVRAIPLGIGQLANKDPVGGAIFMTLEAALIATNIAMIVLNAAQQNPNGTFKPGANPAFYAVQQASAAGLYLTLGFGLLDGLLWSPGRAEARAQ